MVYENGFGKTITVQGFMGSKLQREYMFELGKQCSCAAEIGSWKGFSAAIVGLGMAERKTKGKYYCIDTFESTNTELVYEDTWEIFNQVINILNLVDIVVPVRGYSCDPKVWQQIPSNLDFVYIDGCHEAVSVLYDTVVYAPKVKPDGFVFYHDHPWKTVQEGINLALELKLIQFIGIIDDFGIYSPIRS